VFEILPRRFGTEHLALLAERELIRQHRPKYNGTHNYRNPKRSLAGIHLRADLRSRSCTSGASGLEPGQQALLAAIRGGAVRPKDMVLATRYSESQIYNLLGELGKTGLVFKVGYGRYGAVAPAYTFPPVRHVERFWLPAARALLAGPQKVLDAIRHGHASPKELMAVTNYSQSQVYNLLADLARIRMIRKTGYGRYEATIAA
jgi:hypothetical protein